MPETTTTATTTPAAMAVGFVPPPLEFESGDDDACASLVTMMVFPGIVLVANDGLLTVAVAVLPDPPKLATLSSVPDR